MKAFKPTRRNMTTSRYLHPGALLDELLDVYAMSLTERAERAMRY